MSSIRTSVVRPLMPTRTLKHAPFIEGTTQKPFDAPKLLLHLDHIAPGALPNIHICFHEPLTSTIQLDLHFGFLQRVEPALVHLYAAVLPFAQAKQ